MINYDLKYDNPEEPIVITIKDKDYIIERDEDTLVIAEKRHQAEVVKLFKTLKIEYGDIQAFVNKISNSAQAVDHYVNFAEKVIKYYFQEDDAKEILNLKKDKSSAVKQMYYENLIGEIETEKNKFDNMGKRMM